jgi:hypothetical protein
MQRWRGCYINGERTKDPGTQQRDWLVRVAQAIVWVQETNDSGREVPQPGPNPIPANLSGGTQYTADAAASEFGESFIGIVEIGPQGSRVTAGSYAKNVNHLTLSKQNLGPLQTGQRRFRFTKSRGGITIGPSSTGAIPTIFEVPALRTALQQQGYLTPGGLYLIVAEENNGEQHMYNLMTGEMIQ